MAAKNGGRIESGLCDLIRLPTLSSAKGDCSDDLQKTMSGADSPTSYAASAKNDVANLVVV